jgi:hypothetical protein
MNIMKISLYKISAMVICSVLLLSCKDDEDDGFRMTEVKAPELAVPTAALVLKSEDAQSTTPVTLSWTASDYGFSADVVYTVQVAKKGTNFAEPAEMTLKNLSRTGYENIPGWKAAISAYHLDSLVHKVGLNTETPSEVDFRVKSVAKGSSLAPVYSNVSTISVTPYRDVVEAPAVASTTITTFSSATTNPVVIKWTETDYSLDNEVSYILEVDSVESFVNPERVNVNGAIQKSYSALDFNSLIQKVGLVAGTEAKVYMRIKTYQTGSFTDTVFSNVISINATPYKAYPDQMFLVGGSTYADWTAANGIPFVKASEGKFELFAYLKVAGYGFKFLPTKNNFDGDWGKSKTIAGNLEQDGEDNASVSEDGYYRITLDFTNKTYKVEKMNFAIIGSGAPNGWDGPDNDMTYDETTKALKATLNLTAGEIKFRANDAWDVNFGGAADNLTYNGGNIVVTEAGNYTVMLKLDPSATGKYSYSLTKN